MQDSIKKEAETRMQKGIEALHHEFTRIRTGRANPSLLDHLKVDYYGNETPLAQVASVSTADSRTLLVTPWEKSMVSVIEKAILNSDLGLNPATAGTVLRIPMPTLTEERRKELIKVARTEAENAKISIRNARRDANNQFKEAVKDKIMSEDDQRRAEDIIQKLTDKYVAEVDKALSVKEADLLEV